MVFTHDTRESLRTVVALVNTADATGDALASPADLDAFVARWRFTGSRSHDDAELAAVRRLRPVLRSVWDATPDQVVETVNALLAQGRALPQLVRHDEWDWHLHATTPQAPLATRMAVEAAMALVDVVRSDELGRLRVCAGTGCEHVLVDLSRNRSRIYCDAGCGNRAHVAAYRARGGADR